MEIVFKVDKEWNVYYNRYTGLFSRQGVVESQDEPAFSMALTELFGEGTTGGYIGTEGATGLQYVHVDVNEQKTNHERKNGEIYADEWTHYMVTSDGYWLDVYVNGENVLSMAENNEIYITDSLFSWEVGVGRKTGFNKEENKDYASMNPRHPEGLIRRLFCGSMAEIRFTMNYMELEDSLLYQNLKEEETTEAPTETPTETFVTTTDPETSASTLAPETEVMTQGATEQITESEKNTGCSFVVGFGTVVFLSAVAAAVVLKRK